MADFKAIARWTGRHGRRIGVTLLGFTLLIGGIAGWLLPVIPGWLLVIPGLALLATEYAWARRALDAAKRQAHRARARLRRKKNR